MRLVSLIVFCFFILMNTFNASLVDPPPNSIDKSLSREDSPRKLQAKENYISITYHKDVYYGSFNNEYRHDIKYIYSHYNWKIYSPDESLFAQANVPIDIYFTLPMTHLTNYFWNEKSFYGNSDSNLDYLKSVDFSHFDASELYTMLGTFRYCYNLVSVNFGNFIAPKLEYTEEMFEDCKSIRYLDFSTFNAPNLMYANKMFAGCNRLMILDLSNLLLPKLITAKNIFYYAYNLGYVILNNLLFSGVLIERLREAAKGNLIICQMIPIIIDDYVNNFCCNYNIDRNRCYSENYIIIHFNRNINYNNGFYNGYRKRVRFLTSNRSFGTLKNVDITAGT